MLLKTYERRGKLERAFRCPQCKTLVPNYIPEKVSRKSKARFHVVVTTQIKKTVVYLTVRRNVKFGCSEC